MKPQHIVIFVVVLLVLYYVYANYYNATPTAAVLATLPPTAANGQTVTVGGVTYTYSTGGVLSSAGWKYNAL